MPSQFPGALDQFGLVPKSQNVTLKHRERHQDTEDCLKAIEGRIGIIGSTDPGSIDYKLQQIPTVKDKGAVGNGTTNDAAAIAAADSANGLNFPAGTYRVSSNLTLNSTATFSPGAMITVDPGVTVTFNRQVQAPIQQIFTGAGTVLSAGRNQRAYVEWFGAVANSTGAPGTGTDNTSAINKTAAFAQQIVLGSLGIYRHADSLTFDYDGLFITGYSNQYASQLCLDDATGVKDAIVFGNGLTKRNNLLIENLVQLRAQVATAGAALRLQDAGLVSLKHRIFSNNRFFRGVYGTKVIKCHFHAEFLCEATVDNAVRFDGTSVATADKTIDVHFDACRIEGTSNGAALVQFADFCEGLWMTSTVLFNSSGYCCSLAASSDPAGMRSAHFTSVNFDTGTGGLFLNHAGLVDITSPWCSNVGEGITVFNGNSIQITGGQFLITGGGIGVNLGAGGGTCTDVTVNGIHCELGGTGVFLSATMTGTVMTGCIIRNMSSYGVNKLLGPTDTVITGCRIKNSATANISAGGAGALIVANNDAP